MAKIILIPTLIILVLLGGVLTVSVLMGKGNPKSFWKAQYQRENSVQKFESTKMIPNTKTTTYQKPPKLPVIHLRYEEKVYKGLEGSYCWPTTKESSGREVYTLCDDKDFQDPPEIISVAVGDTLAIETEAHEPPKGLIAYVFMANEPPIQSVRLDTNFVVPFTVNLPVGVYIIQIAGDWPEGDVIYTFKITVSAQKN